MPHGSKALWIALALVVVVAVVAVTVHHTKAPATPTPSPQPSTPLTPQETPTPTKPAEKVKFYVSTWGFGWDLDYAVAMKQFEEMYNVEIVLISGTTAERYTKLVNKVEPVPDVIFLPDYYAYLASQQGLLMRMDVERLASYKEIHDFVRNSLPDYLKAYAVPYTIQDLGIAYRRDLHAPVASWKDLWREDFRGKILWPTITATSGPMALVMTALAFAGDATKVDVSFEKIAELRPYITAFYARSGDPQLFFEREEVDIAPVLRYNWGPLKNLSKPIEVLCPVEGSVYVLNVIAIVEGSKNVELAYKFIDFMLSREVQQKRAEALIDAPINSKVSLPADHPFNISCVLAKPIYLEPKLLAENLQTWVGIWREKIG